MTPLQLIVVTCAYLVELVVVVYFTRATSRRIVGAFAGGAAVGCFGMGAIALGLVISVTPIYLITWRLARRFGWRGLAVFIGIVAIIGPPRDYLFASTFPKWMVFAPGVAPILADAATYVGIVAIGHAVMRLIAGPSRDDRLRNES